MTDFEDPNLPLYPGTLRGYRWWTTGCGAAYSLTQVGHRWEHPVTIAECVHHPQVALRHESIPQEGCSCGIYAWHHPRYHWKIDRPSNHLSHLYAFGVISAWGKIIPGTKGFKAEKAKIEAVWLLPPRRYVFNSEATQIHEAFRANHPHLRYFDTKEALLAAYPPQEVKWSK